MARKSLMTDAPKVDLGILGDIVEASKQRHADPVEEGGAGEPRIEPAEVIHETSLKSPVLSHDHTTSHMIDNIIDNTRAVEADDIVRNGELMNVTLRLPKAFDTYLNDYVYRMNRIPGRRKKMLKQECIAEAIGMFYATHPFPDDGTII